ncbi:MAG TPA: hypothetical protein VMH82_09200 [Myxococcota bacterium]|nr:hypothetical protein [Myxococcota bacterium]
MPDASLGAVDRELENPISHTWQLKLQSNTYVLDIDSFNTHRVEQKLQFQPLITIPLTDQLRIVTRPTIPLLDDKPYKDSDGSLARVTAFGDIEFPVVLAPATDPWLLAAGPTFVLPTAGSTQIGKGKWQAGPAGVFGYRTHDWQAALFAQQWWSFAGSGRRPPASQLKVQYFLTWFLQDGWSIGMSPNVTVNWKASEGQRLTFPVGLGVGKTVRFGGGHDVKLALQVQYMPIRPDDFGQQLNVQLSITPVIPFRVKHPVLDLLGLTKSGPGEPPASSK